MIERYTDEGLRKLVFSDQFRDDVGVGMHLCEDPKSLTKSASTIFGMSYDDMKPDKDHVGIHVVALGDFETYGSNRNGDSFPKKACAERHRTFVTNGAVFIGHNNRDRANAVGSIVKSAYNEPMGRIELFLHVHKDKAQDQLHKLATDGEHPFSMACRVPFDRCNKCNTLRKSASDPNQCEHVRDHLGETWDDGTLICVHNDLPDWFDQSFVPRPADRIAWDIKTASYGPMDSVKLAESNGIWVPDSLEATVPHYKNKHKLVEKLAALEQEYMKLASVQRRNTHWEQYLWELRKAAAWKPTDAMIDELRKQSPDGVFEVLTKAGVLLDAESFFKYALGLDYGPLASEMPRILAHVQNGLYTRLHKTGGYQRICRNRYFDVDADRISSYGWELQHDMEKAAAAPFIQHGGFLGAGVDDRIIKATICGGHPELNMVTLHKTASVDDCVHRGAEIYAAYKLSALDAMLNYCKQANEDRLLALAAVQNLVK